MDYNAILSDALVYIDEHLTDELSAEVLAARASFSVFHFSRVFSALVGCSIMSYIRNRRLTFAAAELSGSRRIIDIALDYGFETHSGFSKAFKRFYGTTPEMYRMHGVSEKPRLPALNNTNFNGGKAMEPKYISQPTVKIAGYVIKTTNVDGKNNSDIPQFWQAIFADGRHTKLHNAGFAASQDEYCPCIFIGSDTEFEYMIGLRVKDGADVPPEFDVRDIPASDYAVFATPPAPSDAEFSATIQATWKQIYSEWFPASEYEYAAGCYDYEYYTEESSDEHPVCYIYIPIKKK